MTAAPIDATLITPSAGINRTRHGWRAKCLQRLVRMDLPVPRSHAISADSVLKIAAGHPPDIDMLGNLLNDAERPDQRTCGLVSVRPSAQNPEWGGPGTVLNVGINDRCHSALTERIGPEAADAIYLRFVQAYAIHIARLDPDMFAQEGEGALREALRTYADEMDEEFPQDPAVQLGEVLRSMARAWDGPTARLLRQAKGARPRRRLDWSCRRWRWGSAPASAAPAPSSSSIRSQARRASPGASAARSRVVSAPVARKPCI